MCSICHSERAIAIEESCDTNRFFASAQNDGGNTKRFFALLRMTVKLKDSSHSFRITLKTNHGGNVRRERAKICAPHIWRYDEVKRFFALLRMTSRVKRFFASLRMTPRFNIK